MPSPRLPERLGMTEFIALFSMITALTALSIDALLPALKQIGEAMGHGEVAQTQLVISLFIAGMMAGELMFGPLADAIGRKPTILWGLGIYALGSLLAMSAQSFEGLILGRVIQGIGASGPKIASRALIRDLFEGERMAQITSFIFVLFILVPMLAPALGLMAMKLVNWRAIFTIYLIWATIVAIWLGWRQRETLPIQKRIPIRPSSLARNAMLVLGHQRVLALTLAAGLIFAAILTFVGLAQAIFVSIYDTGDRFVLWFALMASAIGLGSFLNGKLVLTYGMKRMVLRALSVMAVFSFALWTASLAFSGKPPFWLFFVCGYVMLGCLGMLFGNLNAMAMQWLGALAGLGGAVVASLSSLVAVLVSILIAQFYAGGVSALPMGFFLTSVLSLFLVSYSEKGPEKHVIPVG